MTIVNKSELRKIDFSKPHAFEMVEFKNDSVECVAYITTSQQWKKFLDNYTGSKIWVSSVDEKSNTATLIVA